ncbi:hypothetical protein CQ12_30880 [Bradyrhizobium jicamae]|uniref:Uncharacterized protein n=1 Tax=Bradyrhizobium jicamae TaxID=280332 RepID=A0A0R3KGT8_9BRAD|nr:hypothetical protein [Bradyrhizobium jicamae]KRQ93901.1 hypothetical protein CQ12_30880 [Bradyrhizobium jicamae]
MPGLLPRLLLVALTLFLSLAAEAQTLTQRPVSQGAVTPAKMTERLEKAALRTKEQAPKGAARGSSVDFCWPASAEEYRAIGKYVLVLISVVTQDAAELPLRRVYVTVNGEQTELVKLSSQRSDVSRKSTTYSILGPFREDGFYVAPAGLMVSDGYLQADFAVRRTGFNLYKLPGTPPDFVKADNNPMPARDATPDMPALKALLKREYQGFELPASLR